MSDRTMVSMYKKPILEPDWEAARRFHGHLGPWMALGMRMGEEALRTLRARPHFDVVVRVECHLAPPVSCLVDGLQWMTGATYGKGNIVAVEASDIRVLVARKDTGEAVELVPRPEVPARLAAWMGEMLDEAASYHVYAQPAVDLFDCRLIAAPPADVEA